MDFIKQIHCLNLANDMFAYIFQRPLHTPVWQGDQQTKTEENFISIFAALAQPCDYNNITERDVAFITHCSRMQLQYLQLRTM